MGILDDALNDPGTMGLLNAGGAMLQASGPSLMPRSFGQVLGAGLQGLQAGYNGAQQQVAANQATQWKNLQSLRQGTAQQAALKKVLARLNGAPDASPGLPGAAPPSQAPAQPDVAPAKSTNQPGEATPPSADDLALLGKMRAAQVYQNMAGNAANQNEFEQAWNNHFDPRIFQIMADPDGAHALVAGIKQEDPNDYATLLFKASALKNMGALNG